MNEPRRRFAQGIAVRRWLRAVHRDAGYFVVGLTFVYALSGLAVNHIADWDPNFVQSSANYELDAEIARPLTTVDDLELARARANEVVSNIGLGAHEIRDVYVISDTELDITLEEGTLHVQFDRRSASFEGQAPRPLLRVANWLHLNRGKKAWTIVADAYAILLLYLATSGLFLLPWRGLSDRKVWLLAFGVALPVTYVLWSGGP